MKHCIKVDLNKINIASTSESETIALIPTVTSITDVNDDSYGKQIEEAYECMIPWRRNIFTLPSGSLEKSFINEMTRLINNWCSKGPSRSISIKPLMVLPSLLLQRTSSKSKPNEKKKHLERRLVMWKERKIKELVDESTAIQERLMKAKQIERKKENVAKKFSTFIQHGKINQALRLLSDISASEVLELSDTVMNQLIIKHPNAEPINDEFILEGPVRKIEQIMYDSIDESHVMRAALKTSGAAGPSKLDGDEWRKVFCSSVYGSASVDLRKAVARMTKLMCSENIPDIESIESLLACKLIPLNKNPSVRPIGIGEVLRRIIGKTVMYTMKDDVVDAAGALQLCAGQEAGCEAAVHSIVDIFNKEETEGILQIDASNAFNSINRNVMLHNINIICPELAVFVQNSYCQSSRLFILGGKEIRSGEGTIQGVPVSMEVYALGIAPLLTTLLSHSLGNNHKSETASNNNVKQVAYADDLTGAGRLETLQQWWDQIRSLGPAIGYNANAEKSLLIVKEQYFDKAVRIFASSGVQIITEGRRHLGEALGSSTFKNEYVDKKVNKWVDEMKALSEVAKIEPHAAYTSFMHGMKHRFTYLMTTVTDISKTPVALENEIRSNFIKSNGYECNDTERQLLALPPQFGGLGLVDVTKICDTVYTNSKEVTAQSVNLIKHQEQIYDVDQHQNHKIKSNIKNAKLNTTNKSRRL